MFQTVFSVFFYAATRTAAVTAAVFLYLFIKRLCVCVYVCQLLLSAVCFGVRAGHSFYFVVSLSLSLVFLFVYYKLPNLFTTYKENKPTVILSSFFFLSFLFCVLVCSYLHGCCVCVWFLFLLIIVGFLDT